MAISDMESTLMPYPAGKAQFPTNYEAALAAARDGLARADVRLQAGRLGGTLDTGRDGRRTVTFPCMGTTCRISLPDGAVSHAMTARPSAP